MLSYQHHYHAGNHADVLKHWLLLACVRHMQKKDTPFDYIDTHAGAGLYRLDSAMARKTAESDEGVLKLDWQKLRGLNDYHGQIADDIRAKRYPGSPLLVKRLLRPGDKAWLYEMHPKTIAELRQNCEHRRLCHVRQEDGFKGLPALLPTASRRALVLIDPSYEIKSDYQTVVKVMEAAYMKMPQAMLLLWYPLVDKQQIRQMEKGFAKSRMRNTHLFEMGVADPGEPGMTASGMVVVNPPWTLADDFIRIMPQVSAHLAKDHKARWRHQLLAAE
ncbi:23S rRNA (adenine(2030)-N(6))-methyltransferase RlmJ [Thalassotalea sp. G20_0]|uniref:23S rRNA (adenine(2030)-N(6))-methyltransferase RlmJ n=1 Tax=Thalassotalea sp. G20_0 TaxID=2821093 RepID=UPI001ADC00F9|nr:23S rRNA (adenine(2030)-N(6))-methyltransferase RlmJ [Thalassotalea sp. G20_0]MBO9495593.1 23S rRNA (adenine(2030)-N(6))-methyltransferase RlmJ [Thalassotalea sp. G20_0]